jgi:GNAT superfamily N-acetyltransferase
MPNVKIRQERWSDVPAERKRAFLRMTLYDGMMRDYVRKTNPIVFTAYLPNDYGKKVGWAILQPLRCDAMFYILPPFRRQGIGTVLVEVVLAKAKEAGLGSINVFPHDTKSDQLMTKGSGQFIVHDDGPPYSMECEFTYGSHYGSTIKRRKKKWK